MSALNPQAVLRTRARLAAEDAGDAPMEGNGVDLGGMAQGAGEDDETLDAPTERRLKAAQAICQAVRRLGETLPPHAEAVMGALLVGVCDPCAAVRHSCLGGLADVAATLRLALHPWAVELLQVTGAALEGETDAAARSAACRRRHHCATRMRVARLLSCTLVRSNTARPYVIDKDIQRGSA
jgi:hypothetical protein